MKVYKCQVNLGGPVLHLVPKECNAAEITLLLALHGDDSVRNIEEVADVKLSDFQVYDFLIARYGEPAVKAQFGERRRNLTLPDELDLEAMFAPVDEDGEDGSDTPMMVDPTKAAMEAAEIARGNAEPKRSTLSLKAGATA